MREPVRSPTSPTPRGPYSLGIVTSGRLLFVAGQLPIDPGTGEISTGSFEEQARIALGNLRTIVEAAGGSLAQAARVGVFLSDLANVPRLNPIFAEFFPEPYPARTTTQSPLTGGAAIKVDAVVALD